MTTSPVAPDDNSAWPEVPVELAVAAPAPDPRVNQLLAALPAAEWSRWLPQLEAVQLPLGFVLYESGRSLSHVYFPCT
jgi:hypothetical protein